MRIGRDDLEGYGVGWGFPSDLDTALNANLLAGGNNAFRFDVVGVSGDVTIGFIGLVFGLVSFARGWSRASR
ncbi:MAG: hypothetical protein ACC645_12610 [Pirellulales bacterium]